MFSNIFDVVFIILYLSLFLSGFLKGFWIELVGLIGIGMGYYSAMYFSGFYPDFLKIYISQYNMQLIIFAVAILLGWFLGSFCSRLLKIFFRLKISSNLDRFSGGILGFFRATFLYLCVFFLVQPLKPFQDEMQNSWVIPFIQSLNQFIQSFGPMSEKLL